MTSTIRQSSQVRRAGRRLRLARCLLGFLTLVAAGPATAAGTLVLYNWADYFPKELLAKFEAETGIEVVTEIFASNEDLLANLESGFSNYDVAVPSDYMVKILIDKGLVQAIDASGMPNFRNVKPPFGDPWFDPGRKYSAPNMQGTSGFMYDRNDVPGGRLEESWKEYFDPRPDLAGTVVALDDQRELYQAAAYYLGVDPCTENPDEAQAILAVLLAQKPKLAYYTSGTSPTVEDTRTNGIEAMINGGVALTQVWDGGARLEKRYLPSVEYVIPREGAAFWQDAYVVPYGAWHPENAKVFINWIMDPKNIAAVSNFTGYTNAIAGSEKYMEPALAADQVASVSPEIRDRLRPVKACSAAALDLNGKVWARLWPRNVK